MSDMMSGMSRLSGAALSGLAHIQQSVADMLTTPIGSRVMRREYGSEVPELIDQPLNGATRLRLYAATAYALLRWEPRLTLSGLQLAYDLQGTAILTLQGSVAQQGVQLEVALTASTANAAGVDQRARRHE
ncbi:MULTISPECIES: GPW/gp25 family protein [unclassified Undibacterium]|uniref:GPW/gp25 family protein n=1 Tax=unclassified Undibacterium TaxID=2630295 RepID=UPI002AC933E3|nr:MULTISPECIES: GPW/gp25 family protein [unclassified Undibacterium]MEB0137992.1 GPW/gp25 family protein [Undibacterium sp. CCC2.1]MEB0170675.1 GPW/gp25 family protein [Undibacterium sp. CCC1.1]MEB0177016.1 GPW/gp25 family protein [Undibacterium sp. CCC3.4]MEB0216305.1 GPW/gp25 family protein [Undibacterium sp. 5I2]WPX42489.1 GPW/gp25 family protein [Undibacterium sp. CCC3.4]